MESRWGEKAARLQDPPLCSRPPHPLPLLQQQRLNYEAATRGTKSQTQNNLTNTSSPFMSLPRTSPCLPSQTLVMKGIEDTDESHLSF